MQAVCTCFLHEIPLAPNSVYVNRMGSNFVTAPNVRSGLYKPVVQKNPPLQLISLARRRWFLYDRDVFDALLRPWIILFYKPRVFWFLRIGKQFGDSKKTRSGRNLMLVRLTCRLISTWISLLTSQQATTTGSLRTWIRFLFPQKYAPIEIWLPIRSIVPFIDIIADKWQMQTSLTVTITGQPLSSNNMARQQIEFPISSIGKVLPFHHTRSQLSP